MDHFQSNELNESLRGFYSKNPWDPRVIHTIFRWKQEMKDALSQCLQLWIDDEPYQSGHALGAFIGDYLFFERTAEDFLHEELPDILMNDQMDSTDQANEETIIQKTQRNDPMEKWKKKAKFKTF